MSTELICRCPNGHRVRVTEKHQGRRVRCRGCEAIFEAPISREGASSAEPKRGEDLTESAVLRILGEFDPSETLRPTSLRVEPFAMRSDRGHPCPRCLAHIEAGLRICPACKLYLTQIPDSAAG